MYFDECVSISTFDNSDFSAPEETPIDTAATAPTPEAGSTSNHLQSEGLNARSSGRSSFHLNPKKVKLKLVQFLCSGHYPVISLCRLVRGINSSGA